MCRNIDTKIIEKDIGHYCTMDEPVHPGGLCFPQIHYACQKNVCLSSVTAVIGSVYPWFLALTVPTVQNLA